MRNKEVKNNSEGDLGPVLLEAWMDTESDWEEKAEMIKNDENLSKESDENGGSDQDVKQGSVKIANENKAEAKITKTEQKQKEKILKMKIKQKNKNKYNKRIQKE